MRARSGRLTELLILQGVYIYVCVELDSNSVYLKLEEETTFVGLALYIDR